MADIAIKEGMLAPNFKLFDQNHQVFDLSSELSKGKPLVLFFYPRDYTPICTVEAIAFKEAYGEVAQLGAEVVGISSTDAEIHKSFCTELDLPFRLLTDPGHLVRDLYGARNWLGLRAGRATYVIEPNGTVLIRFIAEFRARLHVERAMEALRELDKKTPRGQAAA